ncbi:MAG: sulfite exporter TauE/SafE family protein [Solirubrobacterales bacterium]|nr:sulfite exporter TauE/SafE family protein [Solirubrobacterales bacterium]
MLGKRSLQLIALGTASGIFSGLFGVGGGTIMVPVMILLLGYGEHEAAGTSLGAIVVIALAGTITQSAYGNVDFANAALIGLPAVAGVLVGTHFQQRVRGDVISYLFACLLFAVTIYLVAK